MDKMYGTMIATEDYLPGAKLLLDSLKQVQSVYLDNFIILLNQNIPIDVAKTYFSENDKITFIPFKPLNQAVTSDDDRELYTVNKIYALNIPKGIRLCLVDADISFLRNCDHYLDFPYGSGYVGNAPEDNINGGVIIFENNPQDFEKAQQLALQCINDEQLWKKLWPDFIHQFNKHIPKGDWWEGKEQTRVFHDDGFPKSWMVN